MDKNGGQEGKTKKGVGSEWSSEGSPCDLTNKTESKWKAEGYVSIVLNGFFTNTVFSLFSDIQDNEKSQNQQGKEAMEEYWDTHQRLIVQ